VVDNASYHNVQLNRHPTSNARKGEMLLWLDKHGIRYSSNMTKAELYDLIKVHKPQYETFAIDRLLADHGHNKMKICCFYDSNILMTDIPSIIKTNNNTNKGYTVNGPHWQALFNLEMNVNNPLKLGTS